MNKDLFERLSINEKKLHDFLIAQHLDLSRLDWHSFLSRLDCPLYHGAKCLDFKEINEDSDMPLMNLCSWCKNYYYMNMTLSRNCKEAHDLIEYHKLIQKVNAERT